jgi:outer membrane protein OmpA-like peptidoglycan-associated protein
MKRFNITKGAVFFIQGILISAILTSCKTAESQVGKEGDRDIVSVIMGCPPAKNMDPAVLEQRRRARILGGLPLGTLEKIGTGDYLDKVYVGIKNDFEDSGMKFDQVGDGLQGQGISLSKIRDSKGKTKEILVNIDGDLSFPSGSSQLTPAAKKLVGNIADAMNAYPETAVSVEGHTDTPGTFQGNLRLSRGRAMSVKTELKTKHNMAEPRFLVVDGYADQRKIVQTTASNAQNRRTEIKLTTVKLVGIAD